MHNVLSEMMWDTINLARQADLAVGKVREAKLIKCLTTYCATTLKYAGLLDVYFITRIPRSTLARPRSATRAPKVAVVGR